MYIITFFGQGGGENIFVFLSLISLVSSEKMAKILSLLPSLLYHTVIRRGNAIL